MSRQPPAKFVVGLLGAMVAVVSTLSCIEPQGTEAEIGSLFAFDSAGVEVSTYDGSIWAGTARSLTPTRVLAHTTDSSGPPLFAVAGAVELSDGSTVVANSGSHQILWFGPDGEFVRAIGGEGEGPGEFGNIVSISFCNEKRQLAVREYDRITITELDGRLVSARPIVPRTPSGGLWIFDPIGDCDRVLVGPTQSQPPPGMGITRPLKMSLAWLDHDGALTQLMPPFRWVTQFGGELQGRAVPLVQPWSPTAVWATDGGRLVFGTGSDPELQWRDLDGTVSKVVRWQESARLIEPEDREAYSRARDEYLRGKPPHEGEIIASLDVAPVPDSFPLYDKVVVGQDGGVWLRRYPREAAGRPDIGWGGYDGEEHWAMLPTKTQSSTVVRLPARHRLLSVGPSWLVAVSFDSMDRESVTLFDLRQAPTK